MALRTRSPKFEMLAQVPLLSGCTPAEIGLIEKIVDEVDVEPGRVLAQEGRHGGEFFIVVSGTATAARNGQTLATFGPGAFFGEMSLLDGRPRSATVTAQTSMHILVLDPRAFLQLVEKTPTVARAMLRELAGRIRSLEETWLS